MISHKSSRVYYEFVMKKPEQDWLKKMMWLEIDLNMVWVMSKLTLKNVLSSQIIES